MSSPLAEASRRWLAPLAAGLVAAALFAGTLQTHANGSGDPYATDVGEIQNALPRWGTLHFTGYPLYSATGSAVVTLGRAAGVAPAVGASFVSLLWGVVAVMLVAALAQDVGAPPGAAAVVALVFAVATSMWMDSSLAEVHTFTMAFTAGCLWLAVRVRRDGRRGDLILLALVFVQGTLHMRPVVLLAPAIAILAWPRRDLLRSTWPWLLAIAVLSPLVYVYMPLREWMGADWTFGQTSTWRGLWAMLSDTKADRIVHPVGSAAAARDRVLVVARLMDNDLPWLLLAAGLLGLAAARGGAAVALGLTLAWLPYAALTLIIWEDRVSDALLAVKLPVAMLAAVGLGCLVGALQARVRLAGWAATAALAAAAVVLAGQHRPLVLAVTADRHLEPVVAHLNAATAGAPPHVTVMAPWGHTFWALAYARGFEGALARVGLVDHNADVGALLSSGETIVTPDDTLYVFGPDWWRERLPDVRVERYAPGLVALRGPAAAAREPLPGPGWRVNDAIEVRGARVGWSDPDTVRLDLDWLADRRPPADYSVAVHLLRSPDPRDAADVLAQADAANPVGGWSHTSTWASGDALRDIYTVPVPPGTVPRAVRVTLYRDLGGGKFEDGTWHVLPLPPPPGAGL